MASRVWLITGCSSGIGLELALVAAARGDKVIATSRSPQKLSHLTSKGITPARLDHNEPLPKIQEAVKEILSLHGGIDVVVNNAAYVQTGMLEEAAPADTERQFLSNVFGPLNVYRAVLPHLRSKHSGTLVSIGSMAAWYPMAGCNLYNATKAALRWVGIGLEGEVAHLGIKHMLVEPGFFRTELLNPQTNFATTTKEERLPDYADINATNDSNFVKFNGAQLGNPKKGAEVLYDVVTSTGVAKGRELPSFLPLGSDASTEIKKSAEQTIKAVEEWRSVSALSDFPEGQ